MADHLKYINYLKGDKDIVRSLTDQLPIGIYRTSLNGKILYANPTLAKMLEYTQEEIYKINAQDLFIKKEQREQEIESLLKTPDEKVTQELYLKTKNGKTIIVKDTVNIIRNRKGNIKYFDGVLEDITIKIEAKEALIESQARYKILTDLTIEGIIIHDNGIIVDSNTSAQKMIGYSGSYLKGKSAFEFIDPNSVNLVKEKLKNKYPGRFEIELIREDKTKLIVEVEAKNVTINNKNLRVVALRNISKHKSNEKEVLKLSTAITQSPVSVIITDLKGNIEYVNPKFTEVTGYKASEVIGKNPRILKTEHTSSENYKEMWETISSGGTWRGEFLNKRKDGSNYWELASISPIIDNQGNTIQYLAIKEDITERKAIQDALVKSEHELKQANATKNMFFSIMAHDLKGPIGSFYQLLNLYKDNYNELSAEEKKDYINILIGLSGKTNNLLEDILLWARIQMNTLEFEKGNYSLNNIITETIFLLKERTDEKDIEIISTVNEDIEINANRDSVKTILRNLVSNGIKFSPRKSRIKINASLTNDKEFIQISIDDKGVGISKENIDKLFKIESTFTTYGTEKEKGTGLGLILCKELVNKNGGNIRVESKEGIGSTFYFTVPVKQ